MSVVCGSLRVLEPYLGFECGFVPTIGPVDKEGRRRRGDAEAYLVIDDRCVECEALDVRERRCCDAGIGYRDCIDPVEDRSGCGLSPEVEGSDYADAVCISSQKSLERQVWLSTCPLHHGEPMRIRSKLIGPDIEYYSPRRCLYTKLKLHELRSRWQALRRGQRWCLV